MRDRHSPIFRPRVPPSQLLPLALALITCLCSLESQRASAQEKTGTVQFDVFALQKLQAIWASQEAVATWQGNDPCAQGRQWAGVYCQLMDNPRDGPDGKAAWYRVESLRLENTQLSGQLPTALGQFYQIKSLDLSGNHFEGEIPHSLSSLSRLTLLDLSKNRLTGSIPTSLILCTSLESLNLGGNFLNGSIMPQLTRLKQLTQLDLNHNNLQGPLPGGLFTGLRQLEILDLNFNSIEDPFPSLFGPIHALKKILIASNKIPGPIPPSLGRSTNLVSLQLNRNRLSSSIPASLADCNTLERLVLSDNQLIGSVPAGLALLPNLKALELQGNRLVGTVGPDFAHLPLSGFGENPGLCVNLGDGVCKHIPARPIDVSLINVTATACAPGQVLICRCDGGEPGEQECIPNVGFGPCVCRNQYFELQGEDDMSTAWIVAIALLSSLVLFTAAVVIVWGVRTDWGRRKNSWDFMGGRQAPAPYPSDMASYRSHAFDPDDMYNTNANSAIPRSGTELSATGAVTRPGSSSSSAATFALKFGKSMTLNSPLTLRQFSFEELQIATNNFSPDNVISREDQLCTYSGALPDGQYVWVKEVDVLESEPRESFAAAMEVFANLHSPYLLEVLGFCTEPSHSHRLLVYELATNGTLNLHLHDPSAPVIPWLTRLRIACDVAKGLEYLHSLNPQMTHGSLTSSAVVLSDDYSARVSDYCLVGLGGSSVPGASNVAVASGALAPELAWSREHSPRSDVYAMGVLLLELLSGRQTLDSSRPPHEHALVRWAKPRLTEAEAETIIDPRLQGVYQGPALAAAAGLAAKCLQSDPEVRPLVSYVVDTLEKLIAPAVVSQRSDIDLGDTSKEA